MIKIVSGKVSDVVSYDVSQDQGKLTLTLVVDEVQADDDIAAKIGGVAPGVAAVIDGLLKTL